MRPLTPSYLTPSYLNRGLAVALCLLTATTSHAALLATDWTSVNLGGDTATGTIGTVTVSLAGTGSSPGNLSFFAEDATIFDTGAVAPPLTLADQLELGVGPGAAQEFTLSFGSPVLDPRIHFISLVSSITFTGGVTSITRIDGTANDANFSVSGLVVSAFDNLNDANGTIRLDGLISSVTFNAVLPASFTIDGVNVQVLADTTVVPAPGALGLLLTGVASAAAYRLRRRRSPVGAGGPLPRPHNRDVLGLLAAVARARVHS